MNEAELERARKNYNKQIKLNEKKLLKHEEVKELLNDSNVKRYIELQKYLNYSEPTKIDMAEDAFGYVKISRESSNNILVYVGSYNDGGDILLMDNEEIGEKSFWDLETTEIYNIPINDCGEFEKNNFIIYMPEFVRTREEYDKGYFKLRRYFFSELIDKPQEEVVKALKKRKTIETILKDKSL